MVGMSRCSPRGQVVGHKTAPPCDDDVAGVIIYNPND